MSRSLYPGDAGYDQAMREAKQALADTLANNSMKGRGRVKKAAAPVGETEIADDDGVDLSDVVGEAEEADAAPEPEPKPTAKKGRGK